MNVMQKKNLELQLGVQTSYDGLFVLRINDNRCALSFACRATCEKLRAVINFACSLENYNNVVAR